jgi:hypothetical protein
VRCCCMRAAAHTCLAAVHRLLCLLGLVWVLTELQHVNVLCVSVLTGVNVLCVSVLTGVNVLCVSALTGVNVLCVSVLTGHRRECIVCVCVDRS